MRNAKNEFVDVVKGSEKTVKCAALRTEFWNFHDYDRDENIEYPIEREYILKENYTEKEYNEFLNSLDFKYDNGYGSQELYGTCWFTDGTWMEREEYDGSEWWSVKQCPPIDEKCRCEVPSINTEEYGNKFIKLCAGVRYIEDCAINEEKFDKNKHFYTDVPFLKESDCDYYNYEWTPEIDVENGRILNWTKGTTLYTWFKVCDCCAFEYIDKDIHIKYDNYVPDFISINHHGYGDYIYLTIDENGYIKDWDKESCIKFIKDLIDSKEN